MDEAGVVFSVTVCGSVTQIRAECGNGRAREKIAPPANVAGGAGEGTSLPNTLDLEREASSHLDITRPAAAKKRILRSHVGRDCQGEEVDTLPRGRIDAVLVP